MQNDEPDAVTDAGNFKSIQLHKKIKYNNTIPIL